MSRKFDINRPAQALLAIILFATLAFGSSLLQPAVKVELSGTVARGGSALSLEQAGKVNPGESISWAIKVSNAGDAAARNVQAVGQVPAGTVYVAGSASGGATSVRFSLDGRTFSERPMIRVVENGVTRERPAPPEMYVAVQFIFDQLNAGELKRASYATRVR